MSERNKNNWCNLQKLARIGELASGVAHELTNPLNNIGLILGNALERLDGGSLDVGHIRQALEKGRGQVHRASAIIDHLRTFARTALTPFEPVAIHQVIRSAAPLVEAELRLPRRTVHEALL